MMQLIKYILFFSFTLISAFLLSNAQRVIIKNTITQDMITYQHITGKYSPQPFEIEINGEKIGQGDEKEVILENNEIDVTYFYSFAKGLYQGKRSCKVPIPAKTTHASLAFCWNNQPRIFVQ